MSAPPLDRSQRASIGGDLLIRGAHLLDPRAGLDGPGDVLVRDGEVAEVGAPGTLATWQAAASKWGTRSLGSLLQPAARVAEASSTPRRGPEMRSSLPWMTRTGHEIIAHSARVSSGSSPPARTVSIRVSGVVSMPQLTQSSMGFVE